MKSKKTIKVIKVLFVLIFLTFSFNAEAQENVQYDFAEIIVLQKIAKSESTIKQMYLNSTTDTSLDSSEIKAIKDNSTMFKYMNSKNWEFVNRYSLQSGNTAPAWVNYMFRKKI